MSSIHIEYIRPSQIVRGSKLPGLCQAELSYLGIPFPHLGIPRIGYKRPKYNKHMQCMAYR